MSTLLVHNLINSCLHIEQKRISRRRSIPDHINFDLNQDVLSQIITLRNSQQPIYFSAENLAELRYYFLLNSSKDSGLGITFKTHYHRQQKKITIIKSVIHLSGKAEQYIRSDALASKEIIETHYWLIEQILNQIPLRYKKHKSILLWGLLGLIIIFIAPLIFFFLPIVFWGKVLLLLILIALVLSALPYLLKRYLSSWLLDQLLFGIFSYSPKRRKIGLNLLSTLNIEH